MEYKRFGRTGLKVSELCLGSDNFGNRYGADEPASRAILTRALEAGINFIDTADSYADGNSEEIIGRFLHDTGARDSVVLATKVRSRVGEGPNDAGMSRYHIMQAVENSLRRLRTDRIDLYLIHADDFSTPVEEALRALDDLVRQGKVCYTGCSNWAAWRLMQALRISDVRNLARFECIQSVFNMVQPGLASEVIPMCIDEGVAVTTYSPLGSGFLTGKHPRAGPLSESKFGRRDQARGAPLRRRYWDERRLDVVEGLRRIASQSGEPMVRLALQWVRETPGVTCPIIGARTLEQLNDTLDAWGGAAPPEVMAEVRSLANVFAASTPSNYPPQPPGG